MVGGDDHPGDALLDSTVGEGGGELISVPEGVGVVGEPVVALLLLTGQPVVASVSGVEVTAVVPPGAGEVPWPAVLTGLVEVVGGSGELTGPVRGRLPLDPGVEVGEAGGEGGEGLGVAASVALDVEGCSLG